MYFSKTGHMSHIGHIGVKHSKLKSYTKHIGHIVTKRYSYLPSLY